MMRFEQFLVDRLKSVLARRRVLVVYDPESRLSGVTLSLANQHCRLIAMSDDIISTREQALEALAALGEDMSSGSQLVVYLPRAKPLDDESVSLDPFTPLALAGGVFPDGAGDSYLALCQQFVPEQAGVIEEMFRRGVPSFLEVNSLLGGTEVAPVLSGLLGTEGSRDVLVKFLCPTTKDTKRLEQSANWQTELREIVKKTIGLELAIDGVALDQLRQSLWRYLLFTEFAADLPVTLPPALAAVPKGEAKYHRFVLEICATLRDRTSTQQTYEEHANRVEEELRLATHCDAIEDLGSLDTFAFEERSFLRAFAKAAISGDLDSAARIASERSQSFWVRDGARAGDWNLAGRCVAVLQQTKDLKHVLHEIKPSTVTDWIDFYVSHGQLLATAHRLMEQVAADWSPSAGPLHDVLVRARAEHRESIDGVTRSFQDAVTKQGWPAPGRIRANDVYDRFVRVPWQEGKRVAYLWVDAFRLDLAEQLRALASSRHTVTVSAVCGQLPSITKIGMAALLPGANDDFRVEVQAGELVPAVKGKSLPGLPQRLEYMKESVGSTRFAALELSEVIAGKKLEELAHVEVLVVRTSTIDQVGENNPALLAGMLPGAVRDLSVALDRLADAGFHAAVLATDHGFCWFDSVSSGDAIPKPADGQWVEVKNRALLGDGQPNSQVVCVDAAHVGIRGEVARYVAARGLATFTKGVRYFHEGLSLQECVLPVVQVALRTSATKVPIERVDLFLTYRGANAGTITTLRPSVEVSLPSRDMFDSPEVTFVLEGFDAAGTKVAETASSPFADPATGMVRIARGQSIKLPVRVSEGFSGQLTLRAVQPATGEIFASIKLVSDFHH